VDRDNLETRITGRLGGENPPSIVSRGWFLPMLALFFSAPCVNGWPAGPTRYCWRPATGLRLVGVPNWLFGCLRLRLCASTARETNLWENRDRGLTYMIIGHFWRLVVRYHPLVGWLVDTKQVKDISGNHVFSHTKHL